MSRIGKKPINIPQGVEVKIVGHKVVVKGPKGELEREFLPDVLITQEDKNLLVAQAKPTKQAKAFQGLSRALLFNMVQGVTDGYERKLEIIGVGFKAGVQGENLVLNVGFSHPVEIQPPGGISFKVEKNIILVSGIDKEAVSQVAANIRKVKKPEPYKGKGIRYLGEHVRRKVGKKAATAK